MMLGTTHHAHLANAAAVSAIKIEGASRIEQSAIMFYLQCKVGDNLTEEQLNKITKRLYATGYFATISINLEQDGTLRLSILENPTINKVIIRGVAQRLDSALKKELHTKERGTYSKDKIYGDTERIKAIHRSMGYFSTKVTSFVKVLDSRRVDIIFDVEPGRVSKMRDVILIGNKFLSNSRIFNSISNKTSNWFFSLFVKGFNENSIYTDTDVITALYLSYGFLDFSIDRIVSEYHRDSGDFTASIFMEEGQRYKIGKIQVVYDIEHADLNKTELEKLVQLRADDWYARAKIDASARAINTSLNNAGIALCTTDPVLHPNKEKGTVDIELRIKNTKKMYINRINIIGGVNTSEDVVRRELLLHEGSIYNAKKVLLSKNRLLVTGLFDGVDIKEKPTPDGQHVDLDIVIRERANTMAVSANGGYSTFEGALAGISFMEANVLGRGYAFKTDLVISMYQRAISFMVTKPHVFGSYLDVTVGVEFAQRGSEKFRLMPFGQNSKTFSLSGRYPIADLLFHDIGIMASHSVTKLFHTMDSLFSQHIIGDRSVVSLSNALIYDNRDHPLLPTRGILLSYSNEYAGFVGLGNQQFMRHGVLASFYYSLDDAKDWVLNIMAKGGMIDGMNGQDVQYPYRYAVGMFNLRGFAFTGIGPRVEVTDENDKVTTQPFGFRSNQFFVGTIELRTPTPVPKEYGFHGVVFCDFGTAFGLDGPLTLKNETRSERILDSAMIRIAAGVGLLWISPFGPIRVEFAYPLRKADFDIPMQFRIHMSAEPLTG